MKSAFMLRGRTTRLILRALHALSEGTHVVVVAHPAEEAFRIVEDILHYAAELGIPCLGSDDNHINYLSEVPLLYVRPFGWEAVMVRRNDPQPEVLIDHSAHHEQLASVTGVRATADMDRTWLPAVELHGAGVVTHRVVREFPEMHFTGMTE